jgi:hypothetical protein
MVVKAGFADDEDQADDQDGKRDDSGSGHHSSSNSLMRRYANRLIHTTPAVTQNPGKVAPSESLAVQTAATRCAKPVLTNVRLTLKQAPVDKPIASSPT